MPEPKRLAWSEFGPALLNGAGRSLVRLASGASDLLIPPLCIACRATLERHRSLCAACWLGIDFIRAPLCDRLGIPLPFDTGGVMVSAAALAVPPDYDRARAVARHDGTMRALVHGLKYNDNQNNVGLLARLLAEAARDLLPDTHLVVPIPLERWRLWSRRFNQSAVVGQRLAIDAGIKFDPMLLLRTRRTKSQVGLSLRDRQMNVKGAFALIEGGKHAVKGRNILLVDDVITTGATISAAARALRRAGAARVDVAALALVTDSDLVPR